MKEMALNRYGPSTPYTPTLFYSIAFHSLFLIIVLLLNGFLRISETFERPKTFTLVNVTLPAAAAQAARQAIPVLSKQVPQPVQQTSADKVEVIESKAVETPKPEVSIPKVVPEKKEVVKSSETIAIKEPEPIVKEAEPEKARAEPVKRQSADPSQRAQKQEDLSELISLLGGLPVPVSEISFGGGGSFNFSWYERNIMMRVEKNWKPPQEKPDVFVMVSFTIFTDGSISEVTVKKSSGEGYLDNLALRAVKLAAPFGDLPPGYDGNRLDIEYILRPIRK